MKYRRHRLVNIVAIGLALAVAVGSVWYREAVGKHPIASLGGLIGLICYLLFQVFYDAQSEMANVAVNVRVDLLGEEVRSLKDEIKAMREEDARR